MNSSISNPKSMLKAYGLAAALVVSAHLVLASSDTVWRELYRLSIPSRDDALRLEANIRLTPEDASGTRVVLMGSNQTREDFDVDYLNERFQDRGHFINLGVSGDGNAIEMYMLIPRVTKTKPGLVSYMSFIGSWFSPYAYRTFHRYFNPKILPLIHSRHGWREFAEHDDAIVHGVLGRLSILFRYRSSFQHMVDDTIRRWIKNALAKVSQTYTYHKRKPDSHFQWLIEKHKGTPRFHEHEYLELYQEAFRLLAQSLAEQNIVLLVIDGPTNPLIRHFYDPKLDPELDEFMSTMSTTYGFTRLRKSDLPNFGDEDFNDFTHLNASGRARFNAFIAGYLEANAARLVLVGE